MEHERSIVPQFSLRLQTLYEYGPHRQAGRAVCNLRVFDNHTGSIVIATELSDNPGLSVTNGWEYIAEELVEDFGLVPATTRYIEYYPERIFQAHGREFVQKEEWAEVLLSWHGKEVADVDWKHITREEVKMLVGEVI